MPLLIAIAAVLLYLGLAILLALISGQILRRRGL